MAIKTHNNCLLFWLVSWGKGFGYSMPSSIVSFFLSCLLFRLALESWDESMPPATVERATRSLSFGETWIETKNLDPFTVDATYDSPEAILCWFKCNFLVLLIIFGARLTGDLFIFLGLWFLVLELWVTWERPKTMKSLFPMTFGVLSLFMPLFCFIFMLSGLAEGLFIVIYGVIMLEIAREVSFLLPLRRSSFTDIEFSALFCLFYENSVKVFAKFS